MKITGRIVFNIIFPKHNIHLPIIPPKVSAGARHAINIKTRLTKQLRLNASRKSDL